MASKDPPGPRSRRSTEPGPEDDAPGRSTEPGPADDAPGRSTEPGPADDAPGRSTEPGPADDLLGRLEERLDRASEAAERLIAEATARATRRPPPAGWQIREPDGAQGGSDSRGAGELELLLQLVHSLRDLIPPELQRRLAEALREVLLALRALIDWYLERSGQRRAGPVEVQDIPIL